MALPALVPVAAVALAAGGAYWFYTTRQPPEVSAPPAAKTPAWIERIKRGKVAQKTRAAAQEISDTLKVTEAKAEGLAVSGMDETKAAAVAFRAQADKAGRPVGDVQCTPAFCMVEIDASDDTGMKWFESEGQHIARKAADGAGVEATLVVTDDKTIVIFSDSAKEVADAATGDGFNATPLTMVVPATAKGVAEDEARTAAEAASDAYETAVAEFRARRISSEDMKAASKAYAQALQAYKTADPDGYMAEFGDEEEAQSAGLGSPRRGVVSDRVFIPGVPLQGQLPRGYGRAAR